MINFTLIAYVGVALVLAILGRHTRLGPVIIFLVSVILTPLFAIVYLIVTRFEVRNES
jgi:hypothetical protein